MRFLFKFYLKRQCGETRKRNIADLPTTYRCLCADQSNVMGILREE